MLAFEQNLSALLAYGILSS